MSQLDGHTDLATLLRAASEGDQEAWNAITDRFTSLLWSVARSYRLGSDDAEDVVQNTWLRLLENLTKIDNPEAQEVQGMRADVEAGRIQLDPFKPNSICQQWIDAGYVRHAHARAAVPNGPKNLWMNDAAGNPGRGIQYPFIRPKPGEWHSDWDETKLEPWKEVVRQLMRHHRDDPDSKLATISTEFIPFPDYGGGAKYSIFEHSVACAQWLRDTWAQVQAETVAAQPQPVH